VDITAKFPPGTTHGGRRGKPDCDICHDIHGFPARFVPRGGITAACADCHAAIAGPHVHEHPASPIEGCSICHDPHGSPNRHQLKLQDEAALCIGCHVQVPQFHLGSSPASPPRFGLGTQCTNCHEAVHGSNLDRSLLR
jgi:predicted CXXCH cytochrome family protein